MPVASLIMVAETTGGYKLIMPTMIAVAVSFVVQMALTRRAKYPGLYEAQVPRPENSPVHHHAYYEAVANLLRQRKVRLDDDIVGQELSDRLSQGHSIPLLGGRERLYSIKVEPGAAVAGYSLKSIALSPDLLIIGILREQEILAPSADVLLQPGDRLTIAATPQAIDAFKPRVQAPAHPGREASAV